MTEAPDIRPSIFAEEGPVGRVLDRSPVDKKAPGFRADAQIDAFIRHRHDKRVAEEGGRDEEALWKDNERRAVAARRAENAALKAGHHRRLADVFAGFSARHAAEAERYELSTDRKEPAA